MSYRIWSKTDGSIAVTQFVTEDPKMIDRDCSAFLDANPGATFEDHETVESAQAALPTSRRFRNCWTKGAVGGAVVDVPKARAQRLEEIRSVRNAKLDRTDKDLLAAQEQGKPTAALLALRQALRDLPVKATADLGGLPTPDEIAAYAPAELL
jgi:hypothetical protein